MYRADAATFERSHGGLLPGHRVPSATLFTKRLLIYSEGVEPMSDLFTDTRRWADAAAWRSDVVALHASGPIHRIEAEGFDPLWAVIGHATVFDIERRPLEFTNAPESVISKRERIEAKKARGATVRSLISMDSTDHRAYRRLTADWFKPSSIQGMSGRLDELNATALATLEQHGGRCDFATDIALAYPLQVILRLLGLPESDFGQMLRLTQEMFGSADPDHQRRDSDPAATVLDFMSYFRALTADRRANPRDDLASVIANARIDGEPLPDLETMSYYILIATAGHDTTSAAIAVGMQLLAENPDQLALLQARPDLLPNAVDEMIRIASPTRSFMRTAVADTEIAGQHIAAGDWILLSYPGANHDPKVFTDPLRFDVERPNADRHLAFGFGVHHCLGAPLTRMELQSLFGALIPRLASLELDGDVRTSESIFVGGPKTLPIRYTLR
jgi:cytochrome P450